MLKLDDGQGRVYWVNPYNVLWVTATEANEYKPAGCHVNVGGHDIYLALPADKVARLVGRELN